MSNNVSYLFATLLFIIFDQIRGENPCDYILSVDISHGKIFPNQSIFADGILYENSEIFLHIVDDNYNETRGCICMKRLCARKCCPRNHMAVEHEEHWFCNETSEKFVPSVFEKKREVSGISDDFFYYVAEMLNCQYPFYNYTYEPDEFYLQVDGTLVIPDASLDIMNYCVDLMQYDNFTPDVRARMCNKIASNELETIGLFIMAMGMFISLPFLLATFLVYAIVPELRNLHGKALMGYVSGLFTAFLSLLITQICTLVKLSLHESTICHVLGFLIYLSFLVSFFWLNIMSIDIWWTFRSLRASRERRSTEKKRFMYYSFYAYGMPIILTSFCAIMQYHPNIPKHIVRPEMGIYVCWFSNGENIMLYFYTPIIILISVNMVLFGITAFKILAFEKETAILTMGDSRRHCQYKKDKKRFVLYIKLFLMMGISWGTECLSVVIGGPRYYYILTDLFNALQGLFIFIIFDCKKKIQFQIMKRKSTSRSQKTTETFDE